MLYKSYIRNVILTTINRLRCTKRTKKKDADVYPLLSEQSRHHYARALKQYTKWLDDEGRLTNPLRRWKLKRVVQERYPRDRLQPSELASLVRGAYASTRIIEGYDGKTRAWLFLIASMTGLRRNEMASLVPASFNIPARSVVVAAENTKAKKTAVLPLTRKMLPDLEKWLHGKRGVLFPGLAKKRTRKMIKLDLEAVGLPYKTEAGVRCFHALRNTYISQLFEAGLNIGQVQRRARHSDVRLTMKYAKPRADEADLVDRFEYPGLS